MRFFGKALGRVLLGLLLFVGAFWILAPREPVEVDVAFDEGALEQGVAAYLSSQEARFSDITPGVEKRVIWAGAPEARTDWAVVYLHGFSATSEEIRPLPDRVAQALGANLVFTRLAGHGRGGDALAEPEVADWLHDVAEALAIGRHLGRRVLVIATSTGGTLATIAAHDPRMSRDVAGLVLISPNYRVKNPAAAILTWPGVEWWGPLVAGPERAFEPLNPQQERYWTTRYPTRAVFPMGASVAYAAGLDHAAVTIPAMFVFSDADQVVDAAATRRIARQWGAPVRLHPVDVGPKDDPFAHVIAGDILSPGMTDRLVGDILDWVAKLQ